MTLYTLLGTRDDLETPQRLARSVSVTAAGTGLATDDFPDWLAECRRAHPFRVDRIPFSELEDWTFAAGTGNLFHRSGRFFTVEGLDVTCAEDSSGSWQQPIMVQPEAAVIGILAKEFDGVLHFLMQAKMEPGNPGLLQLSPTVQATPSNYTKVHRGADVSYIQYFIEPGRSRVLVDVLQSEHGAGFYQKSNRNMIVETTEEVPLKPEFVWLTLGQIGQLLHRANLVNMDTRSILSCAPVAPSWLQALHSDTEVRSWFTAARARRHLRAERIPLNRTTDWVRDEWSIRHLADRYFRMIAVRVAAGPREVTSWSQPICEPIGLGVCAFVSCRFGGVPHLLAQVRAEAGFLDSVEIGPTVQYTPQSYSHLPEASRPLFADLVRDVHSSQIRFESVLAEEGGRFINAESTYSIIDVEADQVPDPLPDDYRWITPDQLSSLARHGHYVNVQARSLLSTIVTGATQL